MQPRWQSSSSFDNRTKKHLERGAFFMRRGPMSSSAVADLSASRWTKADGGESAVCKKFESKRLFQSEALQKAPSRRRSRDGSHRAGLICACKNGAKQEKAGFDRLFSAHTSQKNRVIHKVLPDFCCLSWREPNPIVCQCALSVLFAFFVLMGDSPFSPKKAKNPSKNSTDRCLAVLREQIFVQAKIKPDGHNGDIWTRGLAKHERKAARQNR